MMRQVQFEGDGGPDVIRIGEAPVPEPGSGQVLIEVAAAGVNRPDCMQRQGVYPPPSGESAIPGLDRLGCGERAQEVAEIVGEGMKLKADGVGGERAAREPRPLGHPRLGVRPWRPARTLP